MNQTNECICDGPERYSLDGRHPECARCGGRKVATCGCAGCRRNRQNATARLRDIIDVIEEAKTMPEANESIRVEALIHMCEGLRSSTATGRVLGAVLAGGVVSWRRDRQGPLIQFCPHCGVKLPSRVETQWKPWAAR